MKRTWSQRAGRFMSWSGQCSGSTRILRGRFRLKLSDNISSGINMILAPGSLSYNTNFNIRLEQAPKERYNVTRLNNTDSYNMLEGTMGQLELLDNANIKEKVKDMATETTTYDKDLFEIDYGADLVFGRWRREQVDGSGEEPSPTMEYDTEHRMVQETNIEVRYGKGTEQCFFQDKDNQPGSTVDSGAAQDERGHQHHHDGEDDHHSGQEGQDQECNGELGGRASEPEQLDTGKEFNDPLLTLTLDGGQGELLLQGEQDGAGGRPEHADQLGYGGGGVEQGGDGQVWLGEGGGDTEQHGLGLTAQTHHADSDGKLDQQLGEGQAQEGKCGEVLDRAWDGEVRGQEHLHRDGARQGDQVDDLVVTGGGRGESSKMARSRKVQKGVVVDKTQPLILQFIKGHGDSKNAIGPSPVKRKIDGLDGRPATHKRIKAE